MNWRTYVEQAITDLKAALDVIVVPGNFIYDRSATGLPGLPI